MDCCKLLLSVEQMPACSKLPCSGALRVHILADHKRPAVLRKKRELINPQPTFILLSISQPLQLLESLPAWIETLGTSTGQRAGAGTVPWCALKGSSVWRAEGNAALPEECFYQLGNAFLLFVQPALTIWGVCDPHIAITAGCCFP